MDPGGLLSLALDRAYGAFSGYPRPSKLEASPLRDADAILWTLTSAPLRKLTGQEIGPYAGWALTTVGSVSDYKHFLPRILEQAVRSPVWIGVEPSIIAERLKMAHWQRWPVREQTAIVDFFRAAWSQACAEHPDIVGDASDWLFALAALGEDLTPILAAWINLPSAATSLQIASLGMTAAALLGGPDSDLAYWGYVDPDRRRQVSKWLLSAPVQARLQASLVDVAEGDRWMVENALKTIRDAAANFI